MIRHPRRLLAAVFALLTLTPWGIGTAEAQDASAGRIRMLAEGKAIKATMRDNDTARDFMRLLLLPLTMRRYGDRDYYGKPEGNISVASPRQDAFHNGEVAFWAPGRSFAVFFDREGQSSISDLIVMGTVTSGLPDLARLGPTVEMRIERLETSAPAR